jgi:hypothetical protein
MSIPSIIMHKKMRFVNTNSLRKMSSDVYAIVASVVLNAINIFTTCSHSRFTQKVPLISLIVNPWIYHNRCIQTIGIIEIRSDSRINLYPNSTSHDFPMFDSIPIAASNNIKSRYQEINGKHVIVDGVFDAFHLLNSDSRRNEPGYIRDIRMLKVVRSFEETKRISENYTDSVETKKP